MRMKQTRVLNHLSPSGSLVEPTSASTDSAIAASPVHELHGLAVPVADDLAGKEAALEKIRVQRFVENAEEPFFAAAQRWIEDCSRQVKLPLNFCGGFLIVRLYRLITPASEQTPTLMAAVYEAAAAYDFAFLALGHADDEADMTRVRDGGPTRFVTHPNTRAVDGINLLLSGVTSMHATLNKWPQRVKSEVEVAPGRHPLLAEVAAALLRALREASFPILLDRAGLGHYSEGQATPAGLSRILVDAQSLQRIDAFNHHRAHTYFMRAAELASLLAGYSSVSPELLATLNEIFRTLAGLGAAADDLDDMFIDFAAGVHSVCTVMAHLCIAQDLALRPFFRRSIAENLVVGQRQRLENFLGNPDTHSDRIALIELLDEIGIRRALAEHLERDATLLAVAVYKAVHAFGLKPQFMIELVSVVCRDPTFKVPDIYLVVMEAALEESLLSTMSVQAGKFITAYLLERFWPRLGGMVGS